MPRDAVYGHEMKHAVFANAALNGSAQGFVNQVAGVEEPRFASNDECITGGKLLILDLMRNASFMNLVKNAVGHASSGNIGSRVHDDRGKPGIDDAYIPPRPAGDPRPEASKPGPEWIEIK